ncbi:MAG: hypothetical protein LBG10_01545 [Treponema sp.]|jgi:hypothetical protein|nr:hypothetical protein [Treponema sp.]
MRENRSKKIIPGLFLAVLGLTGGLYAQDIRTSSIDVNLIMDGSTALKSAGNEAVAWVSDYLIDKILQDGDRITIWSAAGKARIVHSDTLSGAEGKENIRKILRSLAFQDNSPDFSGALKEAVSRINSRSAMTYTILISGSSSALSPLLLGSDSNLLRYSRVKEFPSWRALVIALDINSQVQRAAAAYLSGG